MVLVEMLVRLEPRVHFGSDDPREMIEIPGQ
jgi:hypothetical protein